MNRGDLPGVAQGFKSLLQMFQRVPMLGENEQPFVLELGGVHQFTQLQEFRLACWRRIPSPWPMVSSR